MTAASPDTIQVSVAVAGTADRDAVIGAWLQNADRPARGPSIVVAEGPLLDYVGLQDVPVLALAAGCPCCVGLVALRVLLTRALRRHRPQALLLLLSSGRHRPRILELLAGAELGVRFVVDHR